MGCDSSSLRILASWKEEGRAPEFMAEQGDTNYSGCLGSFVSQCRRVKKELQVGNAACNRHNEVESALPTIDMQVMFYIDFFVVIQMTLSLFPSKEEILI